MRKFFCTYIVGGVKICFFKSTLTQDFLTKTSRRRGFCFLFFFFGFISWA